MAIATKTSTYAEASGAADAFLKNYATQLTAALVVAVGVTGAMMFFRVYKAEVEAMHEWFGMAFIVAVLLHLTRHRRPLALMLAQNRMRILMALTALSAAGFIASVPQKLDNPLRMTMQAVLRAPISNVAPVLGMSTDDIVSRLATAGARDAMPSESIEALAKANQIEAVKLLMAVVGNAGKRE